MRISYQLSEADSNHSSSRDLMAMKIRCQHSEKGFKHWNKDKMGTLQNGKKKT